MEPNKQQQFNNSASTKIKTKNMTTLYLRKSNGRSPLRVGFLLLLSLALAWLGLSPAPNAFGVSPAPDGGYPNQNTAEGDNALFSVNSFTTGNHNTALGIATLSGDTTGSYNTATG